MSPTETKLRRMEAFARRMLAENAVSGKVWATTDRAEAIRDADFVVVMIQVGGVEAFRLDYEIPLKYGVDQCIADSLGPGGGFPGLRTIPVLVEIARDMEALAKPGAIMLQYANPMAANCLALGKASKVPFVGLCHGVQTTLDLIAGYCGVPKDEITYTCGGINHMDWFLTLRHQGSDLYPGLREVFEKPEYYKNEKVRGEVFRHFGYFMTESTGHLSEYVPWFRKNRRALDLYCDEPSFGGETGAHYNGLAPGRQVRGARSAGVRHRGIERGALSTARTSWRRSSRGGRSVSWVTSGMTGTSRICPRAAASKFRRSRTIPACIRRGSGRCRRSARRPA